VLSRFNANLLGLLLLLLLCLLLYFSIAISSSVLRHVLVTLPIVSECILVVISLKSISLLTEGRVILLKSVLVSYLDALSNLLYPGLSSAIFIGEGELCGNLFHSKYSVLLGSKFTFASHDAHNMLLSGFLLNITFVLEELFALVF